MHRVAIVDDRAEDAEALVQALRRCCPAADHAAHTSTEQTKPASTPAEPGPADAASAWDIRCYPTADALAADLARGYEPEIAFIDIVLDPGAPAPDGACASGAAHVKADSARVATNSNAVDSPTQAPDDIAAVSAAPTPAPNPTGIDAVHALFAPGSQTQVIYVSGYDSFHTQVYRTPHAAYLAKPFTPQDVACAVNLALSAQERSAERPLVLRVKGAERVVRPAEVIYLESSLHLVRVHTARETVEAYTKLGDLLCQLPARFVRTHQSFAVNLDAVSALDAAAVTLNTGETVPVSRRMRAGVREALFAHIRSTSR